MVWNVERFIARQDWLDKLGDPLQTAVGSFIAGRGQPGKQAKNVLNGTWFGHPVHPALTDVPVGAWTTTLALDILAALRDDEGVRRAADMTLATGLAGAAGAALTGVPDWSDTYAAERRMGLLHGLVMVVTTLTYGASLVARLSGGRRQGVALSGAGYVLLLAGAYLGGEEVLVLGYGVNHAAFQSRPSAYVPVMAEADLQPATLTKAEAQGAPLLLVKVGAQIYALGDTCVHAGCSLAEGELAEDSVICPCHGSQFALHDGSVINGPATMPQPNYAVRIENGMIEVASPS